MIILRISICKVLFVMTIVILSNLIMISADQGPRNRKKLAAANNNFAFKLLRQLRAEDEAANLFMSPLSISMLFGILYYGANGVTEEKLENFLGYRKAKITRENIDLAFRSLVTDTLKNSPNFTLSAVNAILVDNELKLLPEFKNKVEKTFFANVSNVDFQNDSLKIMDDINSWVMNKTGGKIPELLNSLPEETVIFILNAVYFKSPWKYPFDPENNGQRLFINGGDRNKEKFVKMMIMTNRFGRTDTSEFGALELPYLQDDIVLLILLPKQLNGLKALEKKLTHRSIVRTLKALRYSKTRVVIPKFKVEFETSLIPGLKSLGISNVFENADFSGMIRNSTVPISEFLHKAVIEVNEEGTVAAAVTSTKISKSLSPLFYVDRPFFFAIIDKRINFVLFMGRVNKL